MPQHRLLASNLLAASLLTSAFALPAVSQSHPAVPSPAPLAATITAPTALISGNPKVTSLTAENPSNISIDAGNHLQLHLTEPAARAKEESVLKAHLKLQADSLLKAAAHTNVPCYTLRSYNFTTRDLKSPHPHASSETDCTPATSAHLKALNVPVGQSPATASSALFATTVPANSK